jgi:hypothetical protein
MLRTAACISTIAVIAALVVVPAVSAQTPTPTGTATAATAAATQTPSPVPPATMQTPIAAGGSITLSRSWGAVGDVVQVHGAGFATSVTVIFVCAPPSLPHREFFATVAQPAGVQFDIPFIIPPHLDEHQGGTEGIATPPGQCAFEVKPPYPAGAAFTVTGAPATVALPNTGARSGARAVLPAIVAIGLLAAFGGAALIIGEAAEPAASAMASPSALIRSIPRT